VFVEIELRRPVVDWGLKLCLRIQVCNCDSKKLSKAGKPKIGDVHRAVLDFGNAAAGNEPAHKLQSGSQHFLRPTTLVPQPADLPSDDVQFFHVTYAKRPFILIVAGRFSRETPMLGVSHTSNCMGQLAYSSLFSAVKILSCAKS